MGDPNFKNPNLIVLLLGPRWRWLPWATLAGTTTRLESSGNHCGAHKVNFSCECLLSLRNLDDDEICGTRISKHLMKEKYQI